MNVLYDSQIFCTQRFGGISKYFLEVMRYADFDYRVPFVEQFIINEGFKEKFCVSESPINKIPKLRAVLYRTKVVDFLNQQKIDRDIKLYNPNIYHATTKYYNTSPSIKKVVTVHDCTHEIYGDLYNT
ncbi:MAG: hypothetical protein PF487_11165, partial [Bacteroidales bacterium]|nr:hypothetical protein [Bacteroidales bacterium]